MSFPLKEYLQEFINNTPFDYAQGDSQTEHSRSLIRAN